MKNTEEPITPKQIEDILQVSKIQHRHWERLLGLKPLQPSYGKGLTTLYSRENLFCLLLLQRLFQKFRFTLPAAVGLVKRLLNEVGLERLQRLPSVTVTVFATEETKQSVTKPASKPSVLVRGIISPRRGTIASSIVGRLTIPLKDLKEAAYGSVT
ncbi:MAG TPA: hypothetical protein VGK20_08620 [Candidatus Binatia bacterium]|jgi:hypothetical protein